jgi:hypothetical protein
MTTASRRCTDDPGADINYEHRRARTGYPCVAHGEWLKKLDDRMWAIMLAACGGAMASVVTLLILLSKK